MSRERYVFVGTVLLAFLAGLSLSHALGWVWIRFGWDDMPLLGLRDFTVTAVISYGLALAAIVFVMKHAPTHQLASEIVDELSKVTWPTREETGNATVVVIVTVIICSAYLGAFDAMWLWVTDLILGIKETPQG
jgi:preprotein translocase subunit SecE